MQITVVIVTIDTQSVCILTEKMDAVSNFTFKTFSSREYTTST